MIEFAWGILITPWVLGICVLLAILCDYRESRVWVISWVIVAALIAFGLFGIEGITLMGTAYTLIVWIPAGIIWSWWRWVVHCDEVVKSATGDAYSIEMAKGLIDPAKHVSLISYWIVAWPFSLVSNLLSDLFRLVEKMVQGFLQRTYERISKKANDRLDKLK